MTTPAERQVAVVRAWVASAEDDRRAITALQAAPGTIRSTVFHAQQAVEKLLKALLISHGVEPEDSHVIGQLVAQLHRLDRSTADSLGPVDRLTLHAVTTRYPPRPGRAPRSMADAQLQADVAVATTASDTLSQVIAQRLLVLEAQIKADAEKRAPQNKPPIR
ncbi:MAG: HEPN domain-containing protein [Gemmatimonadaceae bacterium]|nr:HEPN domain-containing protein [Gemmatimonadaceae bacterium]